jgi:hypothetical protein
MTTVEESLKDVVSVFAGLISDYERCSGNSTPFINEPQTSEVWAVSGDDGYHRIQLNIII